MSLPTRKVSPSFCLSDFLTYRPHMSYSRRTFLILPIAIFQALC